MDSKDVIIEGLDRIQRSLRLSLEGLTTEQLTYRPSEQANTIAWLAWHLTRVQDHHLSDLAGRPQAWVADGWHEKFGKPADPSETGQGYAPDQVAAIKPGNAQLLRDYHDAVHQRSVEYVQGISAADLDRELDEPQYDPLPTAGVRLVSVLSDNLHHAGQAAYVKGLIQNRRWFPA
jgi:uncharacterized damage-inducible protein DinB